MKILWIAVLVGSVLGAGGGTLAATLGAHPSRTPVVQLSFAARGQTNRLLVPGVALAAGDWVQRPVDLRTTGGTAIVAAVLTTAARPVTALETSRRRGLHLRITRCPHVWKRAGPRFVCSAATRTVLSLRPVLGTSMPLANLAPLQGTAHLLITLILPQSAPNSLQGLQAALTYTFTAE